MIGARRHSQEIKAEADRLLQETGLFALLEQFGTVELGGSYAFDLMVDRDLDFGVAVNAVTPKIRAETVSTFAMQPWVYSVNMTDRVNFEPLSNLGAPRGLYLGLTIPFPKERWNIDVWFIVAESLPQDDMATLLETANDEQKQTILEIKYQLFRSGQKQKGITSAEVYKAVLNRGIVSVDELLGR